MSARFVSRRPGGYVTIEHAVVQMHRKPWGSTDLLPWAAAPIRHLTSEQGRRRVTMPLVLTVDKMCLFPADCVETLRVVNR